MESVNGASLELDLVLIGRTGAKDFRMDYKNAFGLGCACVVGLREGKKESDEEEYVLVVGKVMRKNICCSQKPAMMGREIAVELVFTGNLQNCH
nr:hypothetical protein CFP56_15950 [Quercus suber]POF10114.1 hypothetical protein CFP56_77255 [Quercus suber]